MLSQSITGFANPVMSSNQKHSIQSSSFIIIIYETLNRTINDRRNCCNQCLSFYEAFFLRLISDTDHQGLLNNILFFVVSFSRHKRNPGISIHRKNSYSAYFFLRNIICTLRKKSVLIPLLLNSQYNISCLRTERCKRAKFSNNAAKRNFTRFQNFLVNIVCHKNLTVGYPYTIRSKKKLYTYMENKSKLLCSVPYYAIVFSVRIWTNKRIKPTNVRLDDRYNNQRTSKHCLGHSLETETILLSPNFEP